MHRRIWIAAAVTVALVATSCSTGDDGQDRRVRFVADELAVELDATVPELLREANVPGAAIALVDGGAVVWSAGYGVTTAGGPPVDATTVFQVGSISKPVAASTILHLAGAGTVQLDTPADSMLQRWHLPPDAPDADGVTLRRLLSHTAGINVGGYLGTPDGEPLPTLVESLEGRAATTDPGPVAQTEAPGAYRYSGGGYSIAQLAAEDAAGEDFATLASREVFQPLGMVSAGYACSSDGPTPGAVGHDSAGGTVPRLRYAELAAAGLCSDVADIAGFAAWVLGDDPIAGEMRAGADGTDDRYGLGLERAGDVVGHFGVNIGFNAVFLADTSTGQAIVVLTNGDGGRQVIDSVLALADG